MSKEYDSEFIKKWRLELEREKLLIHPMFHKELPTLPERFDSADVTSALQSFQVLKNRIGNRFLMSFAWLSPSYHVLRKRVRAMERERELNEEMERYALVEVRAGSFMMGALPSDGDADDSEKPRHKVTLTKGLLVSKYPCTQEMYEAVMGKNPSHFKGSNRPVENVSWCDAVLFCNKLSEMEGLEPV